MEFLYQLDTILFVLAGLSTYFLQRVNRGGRLHLITDNISVFFGDFLFYTYLAILFVISPWYVPLATFLSWGLFWVILPEFIGAIIAIFAKLFINIALFGVIFYRLFTNTDWSLIEIKAGYVIVGIGIIAFGFGISFVFSLYKWKEQADKEDFISNDFEKNVKKYSKMLFEDEKTEETELEEADEEPPEFWLSKEQIEESLDPETNRIISEKLKNLHMIFSTEPEEGKDLSMLLLSKEEIEKSLDLELSRIFNKKIKVLYDGLMDNKELDKSLFLLPDEEIDASLDPDIYAVINEKLENIYNDFPLFRWKG